MSGSRRRWDERYGGKQDLAWPARNDMAGKEIREKIWHGRRGSRHSLDVENLAGSAIGENGGKCASTSSLRFAIVGGDHAC
jgi:hypothetical protein